MNEETAVAARVVALDTYSPVELAARLADMKKELDVMQTFFHEVMQPSKTGKADGDFGVIPGTDKPTLLKPGAEKLAEFYGYAPTVKQVDETVDRETGFYRARVTIALVSKRTGAIVAEGIGEANTKEARYRWRQASRRCPHCGTEAIIKGREDYGGGWLCFGKKGGCGAKFSDDDKAITDQVAGRVENDDPFGQWNTVLKQGKKRGLIDAVLSATRSSGLFTQDMEDLTDWVEGEVVSRPETPPARAPQPPRAQAPARPAPQQGSAQAIVAFGNAVRAAGLFMPDVIKTSKQMFGGKTPEQLPDELRARLIRSMKGEAEPSYCEHDPIYNPEGELMCRKCGTALTEEPQPEEVEPAQVGLGV